MVLLLALCLALSEFSFNVEGALLKVVGTAALFYRRGAFRRLPRLGREAALRLGSIAQAIYCCFARDSADLYCGRSQSPHAGCKSGSFGSDAWSGLAELSQLRQ